MLNLDKFEYNLISYCIKTCRSLFGSETFTDSHCKKLVVILQHRAQNYPAVTKVDLLQTSLL